jgi:hypothetical protein
VSPERADDPARNPRATSAFAVKLADGMYSIRVSFVGTPPFAFAATRNCTRCCADGYTDFDVSADNGYTWVNGTDPSITNDTDVSFRAVIPTAPTHVRYTAASLFPQCALYSTFGKALFPAAPFELDLH